MAVIGGFEAFGSGEVIGWAAVAGTNERLEVKLLIDGAEAVTAKANVFREDLAREGVGDGYHAFYIRIPKKYFDDNTHSYSVRVAHRLHGPIEFGPKVARFSKNTKYQERRLVTR